MKMLINNESKTKSSILNDVMYAKNIQNKILPDSTGLKHLFPESFLIFKPKMDLSGDFYWFKTKEGKAYMALVDCTGHGISGAMLSVVGTIFLNQVLKQEETGNPAEMLKYLNQNIQETFPGFTTDSALLDGMDMGLCMFDFYTKKLQYAGAKRPLILIREDHLIEISGSRSTIGNETSYDENYKLNTLQLKEGDQLYVYTDGVTDQFGGDFDKKYTSKRLQKLLWSIRHEPMEFQKEIIKLEIKKWIGDRDQTDDISLMGVRV